MGRMYNKLFASIVHSTIWREPDYVRITWITMLALADKKGCVWASVPGLADASRVTLEECEDSLKRFLAPDPYSRTQVAEGRRIEAIDGGWWLINHEKFQKIRNLDERREQVRQAVQRHRDRAKDPVITVIKSNPVKSGNPPVSPSDQTKPAQPKAKRTASPMAGKATWLSPYCAIWKKRYGGELSPGQAASAFSGPRKELGDGELLLRWENYCAQTEGQFASPTRFAQTVGEWSSATRRPAGKPTTAEQMTATMKNVFSGPRHD